MAAAKKKAAVEKPAAAKSRVAKPAVEKPARAPRRKKVAAPIVVDEVARLDPVASLEQAESLAEMAANAPELDAARDMAAMMMEAAEEEQASAIVKKGKTLRYLLPANMEIAALGAVHKDLVALEASNDGPFVLDGANLSVIDTAGLQLLISFVSAVQASGKKVSWDNYSVQAYQLASELGVVDQLGD